MLNYPEILKEMQKTDWEYGGELVTLEAIKNIAAMIENQASFRKETVSCGGFKCEYPSGKVTFIGRMSSVDKPQNKNQ